MAHALYVFGPQTFAYFGDNAIALLAVFGGDTDFHQFMVPEGEIDLAQHGIAQTLSAKPHHGP